MEVSDRGLALICEFEGFREKAYKCPAGVWTIGYGSTRNVSPGDSITEEEARIRMLTELQDYATAVSQACITRLNQNQFDALCSFAYNVGRTGMKGSSVIRAHNRGDYESASRAFALWNKAGGKVYKGLVRRRAAEAALYLEPVKYGLLEHPVDYIVDPQLSDDALFNPQAVDREKPIRSSKVTKGAIAGGAVATASSIAEIIRTLDSVKPNLESLGFWLAPMLLLCIAGFCGWIVYEKIIHRREGRA
jgi:lysozyme